MKRRNTPMYREDSKSDRRSSEVWGELTIISSYGIEKQSMILNKSEYTIGRSRRCDVRIGIKTVSRVHVKIKYDLVTRKLTMLNCGKEDDLFLNDTLVKPTEEVPLSFGDIIKLSGKKFKLRSPLDERSVIVDDTQLCSQPPILDESPTKTFAPGGGIRDVRSLPQRLEIKKTTDFTTSHRAAASPLGKFLESQASVLKSPLSFGTPNSSKSVRFSRFNEIKSNGQKVWSPATKRRRVSDRVLSARKQVLGRVRHQGTQVKPKLLLTPTVKPKTEGERRKEIMRRLLSNPPEWREDDEPPKFL